MTYRTAARPTRMHSALGLPYGDQVLALARLADPVIARTIEETSGWPCTTFDRYAATCLLGFADRALDAREVAC